MNAISDTSISFTCDNWDLEIHNGLHGVLRMTCSQIDANGRYKEADLILSSKQVGQLKAWLSAQLLD